MSSDATELILIRNKHGHVRRILARSPPVVYFIQDCNGYIKIGKSKFSQMALRFSSLQTAHAQPLRLLGVMRFTKDENLERYLHAAFDKFRVRGEWFLGAPEILAYIADNSDRMTPNPRIQSLISRSVDLFSKEIAASCQG